MSMPTFLIIGGMKCGTTSLHHYLGEHPEVQRLPAMKETNFFTGPPGSIPYPPGLQRVTRLAEYERLFDDRYAVRGEASPCYALHPRRQGVPERIREILPDVKLIYLVRDPIERAVSQYRFSVSDEDERRPLGDALADLADPNSLYTCPGLYALQLEQYLHHFPQERILVVDQADLQHRRKLALSRVFSFLGVDDSFVSPRFGEEYNTGTELRTYSRFVVLQRRLRSTAAQRLPRRLRRPLRKAVEKVVSRELDSPELSDDLRRRLQEFYAPDVERLRALTGQPFSSWSV